MSITANTFPSFLKWSLITHLVPKYFIAKLALDATFTKLTYDWNHWINVSSKEGETKTFRYWTFNR